MAERTNRPRSVGSVKNLERLTSASRELGWSEEDLDLDRLTRMVTELAEYLNQEARSGEEASRGPAAPEPQSSHGSVVPFPAPPRGDD